MKNQDRRKAIAFLDGLGISYGQVGMDAAPEETFFKGVWLEGQSIYFCPETADVGELFHEISHLLLTPRPLWDFEPAGVTQLIPLGIVAQVGDLAVEAMAYAAIGAAGISRWKLFENGFAGHGEEMFGTFIEKVHPGFALLAALGMSREFGKCSQWLIGDRRADFDEDSLSAFLNGRENGEQEALALAAYAVRSAAQNGDTSLLEALFRIRPEFASNGSLSRVVRDSLLEAACRGVNGIFD